MFAALCRLLCDNALDYVVFTGTAKLRNSFTRLRLNPVELALAEAHQVRRMPAPGANTTAASPR